MTTAMRQPVSVDRIYRMAVGSRNRPFDRQVGNSYDNAFAGSVIGLFETEIVRRHGPWRSLASVDFGTLEWLDWCSHRRLVESIDNVLPVEFEMAYYHRRILQPCWLDWHRKHSGIFGAVHCAPMVSAMLWNICR